MRHRLAGAAVCAMLLIGCAEAAPVPRSWRVEIRQFEFALPDSMRLSPGDTIVWVNLDPVPHTATAADGSWDSGRLEMGEEGRVVWASGSGPEFICSYHPNMRGTLALRE